jgi:hypothetical protein
MKRAQLEICNAAQEETIKKLWIEKAKLEYLLERQILKNERLEIKEENRLNETKIKRFEIKNRNKAKS